MNVKRNIHYVEKDQYISERPDTKSCKSIPSSFKSLDTVHSDHDNFNFIDGKKNIYISKNVTVENKLYGINSIDTKCYSETLPHKYEGRDMEGLHRPTYTKYYSYNIIPSLDQNNNCFPGGRFRNESIQLDSNSKNIHEKPILFTDYISSNDNLTVGPTRINHGIERIWDNPTKRKFLY